MSKPKDLVVLVADSHLERVVDVLLAQRRRDLQLRPIEFEVFVHPDSDPGVYRRVHDFLRPFGRSHRFALVMLDVKFPGSPGSRSEIESELQIRLDNAGWANRSAVVAIEPEFEAWVWSDSPHVAQVLGQSHETIRKIAEGRRWWPAGAPKPSEPKALLREVLRLTKRPPSAAVFGQLAQSVSVQRCDDPAFDALRAVLSAWFGA